MVGGSSFEQLDRVRVRFRRGLQRCGFASLQLLAESAWDNPHGKSIHTVRHDKSKVSDSRARRFYDAFRFCSLDAPRMAIPNAVVAEGPPINNGVLTPTIARVTAQLDAVLMAVIRPEGIVVVWKRSFLQALQSFGRKLSTPLQKEIDYARIFEVSPRGLIIDVGAADI